MTEQNKHIDANARLQHMAKELPVVVGPETIGDSLHYANFDSASYDTLRANPTILAEIRLLQENPLLHGIEHLQARVEFIQRGFSTQMTPAFKSEISLFEAKSALFKLMVRFNLGANDVLHYIGLAQVARHLPTGTVLDNLLWRSLGQGTQDKDLTQQKLWLKPGESIDISTSLMNKACINISQPFEIDSSTEKSHVVGAYSSFAIGGIEQIDNRRDFDSLQGWLIRNYLPADIIVYKTDTYGVPKIWPGTLRPALTDADSAPRIVKIKPNSIINPEYYRFQNDGPQHIILAISSTSVELD